MKAAVLLVVASSGISGLGAQAVRDSQQLVGTLTVRLTGVKHDKGAAMVALTNASGFLAAKGALRVQSVAIHGRQATSVFNDVPYGSCAVQAYHDENANRRLERNFLGIPSEPYGFSNDARGSFGLPKYEQAEFRLAGSAMTIDIRIR